MAILIIFFFLWERCFYACLLRSEFRLNNAVKFICNVQLNLNLIVQLDSFVIVQLNLYLIIQLILYVMCN